MLAEFSSQERLQLVQRKRFRAGAQFDKGFRRLATVIVRYADHDHLMHRRVLVHRLLDHLRVDVETA